MHPAKLVALRDSTVNFRRSSTKSKLSAACPLGNQGQMSNTQPGCYQQTSPLNHKALLLHVGIDRVNWWQRAMGDPPYTQLEC